eukprot:11742553-Alexandrium_andersonii.AAC.1
MVDHLRQTVGEGEFCSVSRNVGSALGLVDMDAQLAVRLTVIGLNMSIAPAWRALGCLACAGGVVGPSQAFLLCQMPRQAN